MQLLIVKLGGLCWVWLGECTGLWKALSLSSTDCSYTSGISMKKNRHSLVSEPEEKNNIYQQHHTQFTDLEIGRKNRSTKSVLVGELTIATLGEFSGKLQTLCASSASFMRWTISIQCVCLDTYALWINRSPIDSTVSFTSVIRNNSKAQNGDESKRCCDNIEAGSVVCLVHM